MECYSDVIVLRHPCIGAARRAANVANVPIINAGDGIGEHPTQALLDLFTILVERGWTDEPMDRLNNLNVTMMGDLAYGRTVKSLAKLGRIFDWKINWVSPDKLHIPPEFLTDGEIQTSDLNECDR